MASQTCLKTLDDVQYFAYIQRNTSGLEEIYIVSISEERRPVILDNYVFRVMPQGFKLLNGMYKAMLKKNIRLQFLTPHLRWMMTVNTFGNYGIREELNTQFPEANTVFGVWGEEQRAYLSQFLDNVVDVAPLVMERVRKFDEDKDEAVWPREKCFYLEDLTTGELFLYILRKHMEQIKELRKEESEEKLLDEFENWIREEAWVSFLRVPQSINQVNARKDASIHFNTLKEDKVLQEFQELKHFPTAEEWAEHFSCLAYP